jgi:hypothetical protein
MVERELGNERRGSRQCQRKNGERLHEREEGQLQERGQNDIDPSGAYKHSDALVLTCRKMLRRVDQLF